MRTDLRRDGASVGFRRGQALIELACGLVTVALVLSVLTCFIAAIVGESPKGTLRVQNELRAEAGESALASSADETRTATESHAVDSVMREFAAEFGFGNDQIKVREQVFVPALKIF